MDWQEILTEALKYSNIIHFNLGRRRTIDHNTREKALEVYVSDGTTTHNVRLGDIEMDIDNMRILGSILNGSNVSILDLGQNHYYAYEEGAIWLESLFEGGDMLPQIHTLYLGESNVNYYDRNKAITDNVKTLAFLMQRTNIHTLSLGNCAISLEGARYLVYNIGDKITALNFDRGIGDDCEQRHLTREEEQELLDLRYSEDMVITASNKYHEIVEMIGITDFASEL